MWLSNQPEQTCFHEKGPLATEPWRQNVIYNFAILSIDFETEKNRAYFVIPDLLLSYFPYKDWLKKKHEVGAEYARSMRAFGTKQEQQIMVPSDWLIDWLIDFLIFLFIHLFN